MWETYSAYANTYGGVIILGVKELDDKRWKTTGLKISDKERLLDNLWNSLHNRNKVNINLLSESDVKTYEVDEDLIIVIEVPMAKRSEKPVYINNDLFNGTFRRTHSGDYKCTINIGERAGSGVPNIINTWNDMGWKEPVIEERFDPDRTSLILEFVKKQANKKQANKKQANKTIENIEKISEFKR